MSPQQHVNGAPAAPAEQQPYSLLDQIVAEQAQVASRYMPVMSPSQALQRSRAIVELKDLVLVENVDYGVIPGTNDKPVLLKPGAEKICSFFGYVPQYSVLPGSIEDWNGAKYGEPLFYYHVSCTLQKDGKPVGAGTGSCSTWERKYRYRASKRTCPACGGDKLIKGKPEWEKGEYKTRGSFICYEKKGGCGAKYFGDDPEIMNQPLGEVANPDFADVINTVQKIADKRAYIAATLSATGASQFFTQDLEDMAAAEPQQQNTPAQQQELAQKRIAEEREKQQDAPPMASGPQSDWRATMAKRMSGAMNQLGKTRFFEILGAHGVESVDQIKTVKQGNDIFADLVAKFKELEAQAKQQAAVEPTPFDAAEAGEDPNSWGRGDKE